MLYGSEIWPIKEEDVIGLERKNPRVVRSRPIHRLLGWPGLLCY